MKKERDIKIRTRLEALRNEIFKVIGWNETASGGGGAMDEIDQANELIEKEMGYLMSSNMSNNLKEVEEALERIKNKEYGKCQHCGAEISSKRLDVLPFAKFCVTCQESLESGDH
ncbi:MAG: TraR/DksA family transcriptional regulator [Candidatus Aminicenantes bacterium]|nr:TraR/DksA family transcriptional regulator [Candidatus Aminicenantes bacterium]